MTAWRASAFIATLGVLLLPGVGQASPVARAAATCSDYSNQAAAQEAKDTRDADGDGVYCETLPCPCSGASEDDGEKRAQTIEARITSFTAL